MQVLVAKERLAREELQNQIEDLKKSISEKKAYENKQGDESKGRAAGYFYKLLLFVFKFSIYLLMTRSSHSKTSSVILILSFNR